MTVKITAMSAGPGAVKYLLKQEGCADHSHAADYYAHGVEGGAIEDRPLGWWVGEGVAELGVEAGDVVTESDVEALIGHVCHPQRYREEMAAAESRITARLDEIGGEVSSRDRAAIEDEEYATAIDNSRLGSAPRKFKSTEERVKARLEAEPLADKKRIDAIRLEEAKATRKAVGFFDITLSAPKSISIYHAGLLATGRIEDATVVEAAHRAGTAAALKFAQQEAGYSRAGHHGGSAEHRASSGRYVDAHEWIGLEFLHLTSRAGDPQIHSHITVPNRVLTVDADGTEKWRTLDSWSMKNVRLGMDAEYTRAMEQHLEESHLPVVLELRPDGVAREIVGSTEAQRAAFSTRKGEVDKDYNDWAAAYEARRGHEPGRYLRAMMREQFVLASRDRKAEVGATTPELAARYEAAAMERLGQSLGEAVAMMENAGREADRKLLAAGGPQRLDRPGIIAQAVARVQEKKTTWTAADLRSELGMVVPRLPGIGEAERKTLFDGMVADALAGRAGLSDLDRPVQVGGFEVLPTPADLQLLNGKSTFDPPTNARYATTGQLSNEERLVSMANTVRPELVMPAEKVERVIREANLSGDQAQAVREILTGGREWQTLIGPAGAGKTYVTAVVVKAWEEHFGGKVVGLAPSQAAAEVLREAGVTTTMNTTRFLGWNRGDFAPTPEQKAMAQLGPRDMVILDEAGMAANPHMFELGEVARAAGAKVLGAGDDAQLTAVGAGGGLRMLTEHAPFVELDTVRRFRNKDGSINEWYADASLRLRSGDATVVPELHKRGLLHQGTADEMTERDVRRHVANMLDGRTGALSASKNETAARLNNEIRSRLVEAGVVEERGLWLDSEVAGGVTVGRGDEIVARKNTRKNDSAGDEVVNRRHYTVDEVRPDGSLAVRRILDGQGPNGETQYGGQAVLPADYVREQVALGYATTVHGVQGATVDEGRGHGMPDSAEALYVVLTRGRSRNEVSHIQEEPSHDNPEPRRETAMEAATRAMENRTAELSATDLLRRDQDLAESMLTNGPKWIEMQELGRRSQLDRHMAGLLGPDLYARLNGEDPSSLYRLVRSAELDGHDPKKLLEEAVAWRELPTAHTLPSVLHWRLTEKILPERQPDLAPTGPTYPERTLADLPARDREWTLTVANQLEERKAALGERAAAEPPPWALDRLGPVPEDPIARLDWTQRAGTVAAYREWYGRNLAPGDVLGAAPAPAMVEQHRDWREAHTALGLDVDARQLAEATDAQLLLRVKQYERAREWAPREVSDVMRETYVAVDEMELSVKETRYKARTVADPAEREQAERLLAAYELMGDFHAGQTEQLEKINAAYDEWHAGTARERETAYDAQAELDRRAELAPKEAPDADEAYAVDPEPVDLDAWWEDLEREAADREAEQDLDQAPEPDTGPELDPAAEQEPVDVEQDQDVTPEPEDLEPQAEAEQEPVDVEQAEELDPDAVADQPADVEQDQDVEPAAAPEPDEPGPAVDVDPAAAEQDVEPTAEAEQQPVDVAPEAEAVPEELWEADLAAADHRPDVDLDEPDPETVPVLETEAAPATAPEVEPELDLAAEVDRAQAALDQLAAQRAARAAVEAEAAAERTAAWAARERPALDATVQRTQTPSMGIERE